MTPEQIRKWRADAIVDGWSHEAIYKHEPEDNATRLNREGWEVQVYLRPSTKNRQATHGISVWGPDTLAIKVPEVYDWEELQNQLMWCSYCDTVGSITVRLGFAGRACPPCREKHKAEVEYPGWTH